jgi:hypothetical protein
MPQQPYLPIFLTLKSSKIAHVFLKKNEVLVPIIIECRYHSAPPLIPTINSLFYPCLWFYGGHIGSKTTLFIDRMTY